MDRKRRHQSSKASSHFPADYTAGKKYPFLVLPHGGPEANDEFRFDLFSRLISGMGYVVLQPEYRGSTGYGADFLVAIYQHFGDRAYSDVDSATDFAIAQGWADPNRLAIFGWSAGGFMTSWTVTQTHRYKRRDRRRGHHRLAELHSHQRHLAGRLRRAPAGERSHADAAVLRGDACRPSDHAAADPARRSADLRVPTFQGREYYVLLAERGKTVRMVTYPGSPHFPRLAEQRRDVFKEVQDWLKRYNP